MRLFLFFILLNGIIQVSFGQEVFHYDDSTGAVDTDGHKQWGWRYWYKGKLAAIKEFRNDTLNGYVRIYYTSGKPMYQSAYLNGSRNGETKKMDEAGGLIYTAQYYLDTLHGKFIEYYKGNIIRKEISFYKGKVDGRAVAYDEKGRIVAEGSFANGIREGTYKYYSSKGGAIIEKYLKGKIDSIRTTVSKEGIVLFEDWPDSTATYYNKSVSKKTRKSTLLDKKSGRSLYGDFLGLPFSRNIPPFVLLLGW